MRVVDPQIYLRNSIATSHKGGICNKAIRDLLVPLSGTAQVPEFHFAT